MNNIFPTYIQGPTIGALVIEHMNGNQRMFMRKISKDWKNLADRSSALCSERAKELVDTYLNAYCVSLKVSFVQPIDPERLDQKLKEWAKEIRGNLLIIFQNFPQRKLEEYVKTPDKSIIEKGETVIRENVEKISRIGAKILEDILFMGGDKSPSTWKPSTIAQSVSLQQINELVRSVIAGTIKRMRTAIQLDRDVFKDFYDMILGLNNNELVKGLQSRLIKEISTFLEVEYETVLTEQELACLYRLRSQKLYKTIQTEIKRPLQLRAVEWITILELG